jgi:electron transfer flavoprotein alpha subunit
MARTGPAAWRQLASDAVKAKERWGIAEATRTATEADDVAKRIRILSPDVRLTTEVLRAIAARRSCPEQAQCALLRLDQTRLVLVTNYTPGGHITATPIDTTHPQTLETIRPAPTLPKVADLGKARIEVREVPRRQVFVDGKPVGEDFE